MVKSVYSFYLYVCITSVPGSHGGQKRTSGPLELEVQTVVNCHGGAGNLNVVLQKSIQCS